MTPRPAQDNITKLTLHANAEVVAAAKIKAIRLGIPVSVLIEEAIKDRLNASKTNESRAKSSKKQGGKEL